MLEYKVLRGADRIGANLIEVYCEGTRILVEFGNELEEVRTDEKNKPLTELERQIVNTNYDACIISHYHGDHAGNISKLTCPVYMGEKCRDLMETLSFYIKGTMPKEIRTFKPRVPFRIGAIKIKPFLCDHSAFDSYMLLFEGGGRSILYTGDWRTSGRKNFGMLLSQLPTSVDVLIAEGTNLGREVPTVSERDLENKALEIMKASDRPVFLLQSCTNMDRLVSFYRAAKRDSRMFYMDDVQAAMATTAGGSIPRPDVFDDVQAFMAYYDKGEKYRRYNTISNKGKIFWKDIGTKGKYAMTIRSTQGRLPESLHAKSSLEGATLIYSMWEGYKQKDDMKSFLASVEAMGINIVSLHVSGHADKTAVDRLVAHTNPKKTVIIHTEK
jgi:ribonuclease J